MLLLITLIIIHNAHKFNTYWHSPHYTEVTRSLYFR